MSARLIPHWDKYLPAPASTNYMLNIASALPAPVAMVHVRAQRVGSDVTLHRIPNFQPGAELLLPLGTQADVALYQVAMYDADGRMIGLAPSEVTGYSRADAAGNGLIVLSDTCDRVVLEPAHLVNLDLPYVVHIANETQETWEEVTMSYGSAIDGTALFASSPVSPGEVVTFELCPASVLKGYAFAIWHNGLRVDFGGGALQFPPDGLMTAERAVEFSGVGEVSPREDTWRIGKAS